MFRMLSKSITEIFSFNSTLTSADLSLLLALEQTLCSRLHLQSDGTSAETRFRLSAKRTGPFKSAGRQLSHYWQPRCEHQQ